MTLRLPCHSPDPVVFRLRALLAPHPASGLRDSVSSHHRSRFQGFLCHSQLPTWLLLQLRPRPRPAARRPSGLGAPGTGPCGRQTPVCALEPHPGTPRAQFAQRKSRWYWVSGTALLGSRAPATDGLPRKMLQSARGSSLPGS